MSVASPRKTAKKKDGAQGHAGDFFGVEALFEDGLLVREDGVFVRYLEIIPRNPLVMDERDCEELAAGFGALVRQIPAGASAQFYVDATPLRLADVLARYRTQVTNATAPLEAGGPEHQQRAAALRALAAVHAESLTQHADDHAAVQVRYVAVLPFDPALASRRPGAIQLRPARRAAVLERDVEAHQRLARESQRYTDGIRSELGANGLQARALDGSEIADLLWRRGAPRAAHADAAVAPSRHATQLLASIDTQADLERAKRGAQGLRDVLAQGAIDDHSSHRWLGIDGDLEQTVYLSNVPEHTFFGWVLHAMQSQHPWTLTVHLTARDRHSERQRYKQKGRRLRGVMNAAHDLEDDQLDQAGELRALGQELANPVNTIYDMSVYASVREHGPQPDTIALTESVDQLMRDVSDALQGRMQRGEFEQLALWRSTLPLGLDVAAKTRPYTTRNVADSLPLLGTSCGSPGGLVLGYADPGRTLEHLDPFDPFHDNGTLIINAKSGGGKTFLVLHLLVQALTHGAQAAVIDRSAGHFKFLCSLIPGAQHVQIGGDDEHTINAWDVEDIANVPASKISFLVRLHAMLIGDHHAAQDAFGLSPLERSQLSIAIREVYDDAARTGYVPCESYLQDMLLRRASDEAKAEEGSVEIAAINRSLAERLHDYVGNGAYATLLDRPTTIDADDAPLLVIDTRLVPEDVSPAVLFVISEGITRRVEARREAHLASGRAGHADAGMFDGRFMLVLEELWKLVGRRATGEWIEDLGRRARHIGLFLLGISQQRGDLAGPYGKALLNNSTMQVFLRTPKDELDHLKETLKLADTELDLISGLRTEKRAYSQAYVINGTRGRGVVSIRVGQRAYWLATSDPLRDVPLRERALQDADGQPWVALDLLCDHDWHRALADG
ncbi:hypothetical protein C8N24_0306 [Solirubrobacter pauli]|uniref:TraG P-loop domain-containing protein n=1 Tax=Solirubrobacter pauli TaxID=166793 RepID=A0A660LCT5_9ACTN|nr:hypothetical protein [Solirubrobacter pauli]RKQ90501.1 hypothetical protein C8N24_0306 [Solirubrobacter pauli]